MNQYLPDWQPSKSCFVRLGLTTKCRHLSVIFRHSGWRESTDFQGHCSMRWAVLLLSLKDVLERGKGATVISNITTFQEVQYTRLRANCISGYCLWSLS